MQQFTSSRRQADTHNCDMQNYQDQALTDATLEDVGNYNPNTHDTSDVCAGKLVPSSMGIHKDNKITRRKASKTSDTASTTLQPLGWLKNFRSTAVAAARQLSNNPVLKPLVLGHEEEKTEWRSSLGVSPLGIAVVMRDLELVNALLSVGADPNFRSADPVTACGYNFDLKIKESYKYTKKRPWDTPHPLKDFTLCSATRTMLLTLQDEAPLEVDRNEDVCELPPAPVLWRPLDLLVGMAQGPPPVGCFRGRSILQALCNAGAVIVDDVASTPLRPVLNIVNTCVLRGHVRATRILMCTLRKRFLEDSGELDENNPLKSLKARSLLARAAAQKPPTLHAAVCFALVVGSDIHPDSRIPFTMSPQCLALTNTKEKDKYSPCNSAWPFPSSTTPQAVLPADAIFTLAGNTCMACGRWDNSMPQCDGCSGPRYCDVVCQRKDWENHKGDCALAAQDKGVCCNLRTRRVKCEHGDTIDLLQFNEVDELTLNRTRNKCEAVSEGKGNYRSKT